MPSSPKKHNRSPHKVNSLSSIRSKCVFTGHIAVGWVIVIALAISLFLILLLVIGGLIAARIRRSREGYMQAPSAPPIREASLERVPPGQLLEDLEARRRGYPML